MLFPSNYSSHHTKMFQKRRFLWEHACPSGSSAGDRQLVLHARCACAPCRHSPRGCTSCTVTVASTRTLLACAPPQRVPCEVQDHSASTKCCILFAASCSVCVGCDVLLYLLTRCSSLYRTIFVALVIHRYPTDTDTNTRMYILVVKVEPLGSTCMQHIDHFNYSNYHNHV